MALKTVKATIAAIRLENYNFPLEIKHASCIAGPFIIWKLKKRGFSDCRVFCKKDSLFITANR